MLKSISFIKADFFLYLIIIIIIIIIINIFLFIRSSSSTFKCIIKNLFIYFFIAIECKNRCTIKMQPLWISKDPWITEEKGKLINWESGGVCVCAPGVLKAWRL